MPKIRGLSSAANAKRDQIAKAMIRDGAPPSKAYAVSAAQVEGTAKRGKRKKKKRA